MRGKSIASLLVAALAGAFSAGVYYEPGFGLGSRGRNRRSGPGWSNRHVQRMARKKRNQARHRKASR